MSLRFCSRAAQIPRLTFPASTRISFHCYSLPEEVDRLIEGLHKALEVFAPNIVDHPPTVFVVDDDQAI